MAVDLFPGFDMRKTKIIATLGPATDSRKAIAALIEAGVDAVRLNFSHGDREEHRRRSDLARRIAEESGRPLAVLADLQGPKIRTGRLRSGPVNLEPGQRFVLTAEEVPGSKTRVSIGYKQLPAEIKTGEQILLDDGKIRLEVVETTETDVITDVIVGGELSDHKAINLPGTAISAPSLTEKDLEDLRFALLELGAEYVALSFVRSAEDILRLKGAIAETGGEARVIAKIEKPEAIENIENILSALELGDGLMVARGDLGVEMEIRKVPRLQKMLLRRADETGIICITATQMLESMVDHPMPTRAESSDVFNAILDGTDAAMLSGETAIGRYPAEAVGVMVGLICEAEEWRPDDSTKPGAAFFDDTFELAICRAASFAAGESRARAIVALTQSGRTALLMSKTPLPPRVPFFAFTANDRTYRTMALYYSVEPVLLPESPEEIGSCWDLIDNSLLKAGSLKRGDTVVIVSGFSISRGATNVCKIVKLGERDYY